MKKYLVILLVMLIALSACRTNNNTSVSSTAEILPTKQREIPPFEKADTYLVPTSIDLNYDSLYVVETIVYNSSVLFTQHGYDISNGQFNISDLAAESDNESTKFTGSGEIPRLELKGSFADFESSEAKDNQGILLRFRSSNCTDLKFIISSVHTNYMWFFNGRFPKVDGDAGGALLQSWYDCNYTLEPNAWNYIFMTIDDYSNARYAIWQEGYANNIGYYYNRFAADMSNDNTLNLYASQSLNFAIEIGLDETVSISQYWIIDYEEIR